MPHRTLSVSLVAALGACTLLACATLAAAAQVPRAFVTGRAYDVESGLPIPGAWILVEGSGLRVVTDTAGQYRIGPVPAGPQVLALRHIGYAPARISVTVPTTGTLVQDIAVARVSLELPGVVVTADPSSRARGELGTASVIDRDAVANQTASSLAGVLELVPGVPVQPPGLDAPQPFALRAVPTNQPVALTAGGPSAGDIASFGTLIILDGVPLSNNANLQTTGPRGELEFLLPTAARGGIDLRRIPASTIERVEVIRGVPSARYSDLTQGVVVVETRAGAVEPTAAGRYDPRTAEASLVGGREFAAGRHALTLNFDFANTRLAPGLRSDNANRLAAQLSHRLRLGGPNGGEAPLVLDSRLDVFQVYQNSPEEPELEPGRAAWNRDRGIRLLERASLALGGGPRIEFTGSLEHTRQRSYAQLFRIRGATPFTDRLEPGRSFGRFIGGEYLARLWLEGDPWLAYGRLEGTKLVPGLGFDHYLRVGAEVRREWNTGPGYRFDVEFPPQATFNGVQGFDRPRPFDEIPPVATSALYVDDRLVRALPGGMALDLQGGLRLDLLHRGTNWLSGARDAALQPRVNVQVAPRPWLRLRGGWGRTAKAPNLGSLYPAPQWYDVVNVNWFTPDPAERLAVLTTFNRDPTNPDLGFAVTRKMEAGFEVEPVRGAAISVVAFDDRTAGGVGVFRVPDFLLRDRYDFVDSTQGTGQPPTLIEPPSRADTVPILIERPANNLSLRSRGWEITATFPEIRPIATRLAVQGAWVRTEFHEDGPQFGPTFSDLQMNEAAIRAPYWDGVTRIGERAIVTYRLISHIPEVGLVVTTVLEHTLREFQEDLGATDSLAFAGYITRDGQLVPVAAERRLEAEFADLRRARRTGLLTDRVPTPADWLLSVQVSKTLPLDGRLSFYAFNLLDRRGRLTENLIGSRRYPPLRFGLEVAMPLGGLVPIGR